MLVLAPTPELLALLEKLVEDLEPLAADAVAALKAHLAEKPGEMIPHALIVHAAEAAAEFAPLRHPAVAAARAVFDHVEANAPSLARFDVAHPPRRVEPSARPTAPATPSSAADASPAGGAATPTAAEASA